MTVTAGPGRPGLASRNPQVQRLRRLARDPRARAAERAFLVEGPTLVAAALAAGAPVEAVYADAGFDGPVLAAADAAGVAVRRLAPGVVARVASTTTPQPVVAVTATRPAVLADLREATLVVVCAGVGDPGNLGTLTRSALAAGAGGVFCGDGGADPYNPKCVRASAGALFHLQVVSGGSVVDGLDQLGSWGLHRLGARASGGTPYDDLDLSRPTALVVGNEAHGLGPEVDAVLDGVVTIPMAAGSESLNVAAAAAVLCFEAARQRRHRP
ncbi:MAG: TrmH family RNA methyltransferase [Acidimicrobiales bacterium]